MLATAGAALLLSKPPRTARYLMALSARAPNSGTIASTPYRSAITVGS